MVYILILTIVILSLQGSLCKNICKPKNKSLKLARIHCRNRQEPTIKYVNIKDCNVVKNIFSCAGFACKAGCLGLNNCIEVCPVKAINDDLDVDISICIGCGLCVEVCPQNLIELYSPENEVFVSCRMQSEQQKCAKSCQLCYLCLSTCPELAIELDERQQPVINYAKCTNCKQCVLICPVGVMQTVHDKQKIL